MAVTKIGTDQALDAEQGVIGAMLIAPEIARDVLARYLQKMGRPYLPYETFFDVIHAVESGAVPLR